MFAMLLGVLYGITMFLLDYFLSHLAILSDRKLNVWLNVQLVRSFSSPKWNIRSDGSQR